jgi:hypothetical protein
MVSLNRDLIVSGEVSTDPSLIQSSDVIWLLCWTSVLKLLSRKIVRRRGSKKVSWSSVFVMGVPSWCGPFRIVSKASANIYNCLNLRTNKNVQLDGFFSEVPPHVVDPVAVAGLDEGEYLVEAIVAHRLEGTKKKNRTHYYFLVKFGDGEEEWIPYWEVRKHLISTSETIRIWFVCSNSRFLS